MYGVPKIKKIWIMKNQNRRRKKKRVVSEKKRKIKKKNKILIGGYLIAQLKCKLHF